MNKIILGKYVNTHGLKGEIRIKSNFKYKNLVFRRDSNIIIENKEYKIMSYRVHKDYDMVTLDGIDDINKIPFRKNTYVYIDRDKYLKKNDYLDSDLIGFIAYNSKLSREVVDIMYLVHDKKLLVTKDGYIPFELIDDVDLDKRKIKIKEVEGL